MEHLYRAEAQDKVKSATAVAAVHALLAYGLLTGLGAEMVFDPDDPLKVFTVAAELPPPPQIIPLKDKTMEPAPRLKPAPKDPEGAAAPPNIRSRPTEIVAPKPEIVIPVPPPVIFAPVAGPGAAATSGNAPVRGPGTGAGGFGTGTGSGRFGDGGGGGGGAGAPTPARQIAGAVRDSDYPRSALDAGISGTVYLRFVVTPEGRVGSCRVTRSSGNAALDTTTCRLIRQRFRYRPARDAWGRRVADTITGEHVWETEAAPDRWIEADVPEDYPQ